MPKEKVLLYIAGLLSIVNIFLIYASFAEAAGFISVLIAAAISAYFIVNRKTKTVCTPREDCPMLQTEREAGVTSLKDHLSEQKHDFLNLLQIVYGYTQLKRPEKVLSQISVYSKKVENIGAVYNAKCIKLADLLYTKGKEAEIIDLQLHYDVKITFEPQIRMLEDESVLFVVDGIISNCYYAFHKSGLKNCNLVFGLRENEDSFEMEVSFRDALEGYSILLPEELKYAEEELHWNKISRQVPSLKSLEEHCKNMGYELSQRTGTTLFKLKINKRWNNVC